MNIDKIYEAIIALSDRGVSPYSSRYKEALKSELGLNDLGKQEAKEAGCWPNNDKHSVYFMSTDDFSEYMELA